MSKRPGTLREYRVTLTPVADGETAMEHGYPDNLGLRTKLGGEPTFIQGGKTPNCSECGKQLHFVAQIDSVEHKWKTNPNARDYQEQHFMFGDVGMIYVFFCFECGQPSCAMDCY
jgi:hypothetical protein